jgi:hypothetical protein
MSMQYWLILASSSAHHLVLKGCEKAVLALFVGMGWTVAEHAGHVIGIGS